MTSSSSQSDLKTSLSIDLKWVASTLLTPFSGSVSKPSTPCLASVFSLLILWHLPPGWEVHLCSGFSINSLQKLVTDLGAGTLSWHFSGNTYVPQHPRSFALLLFINEVIYFTSTCWAWQCAKYYFRLWGKCVKETKYLSVVSRMLPPLPNLCSLRTSECDPIWK